MDAAETHETFRQESGMRLPTALRVTLSMTLNGPSEADSEHEFGPKPGGC